MSYNAVMAAIGAATFILVGGFIIIKSIPILYDYRVKAGMVEIFILKLFPVLRIPVDKILEVSLEGGPGFSDVYNYNPFRTLRLPNRLSGSRVVITKKGIVKYIIFTPKNASSFYESIHAQLEK